MILGGELGESENSVTIGADAITPVKSRFEVKVDQIASETSLIVEVYTPLLTDAVILIVATL